LDRNTCSTYGVWEEAAHTKTLDNTNPGIYPARKGRSAVATDHVNTPI